MIRNNIFISGVPNKLNADMTSIPDDDGEDDEGDDVINSPEAIVHHIFGFLHPTITNNCYKILKSFDARASIRDTP